MPAHSGPSVTLGVLAQTGSDPDPFGKQSFYFNDMIDFGQDIPVELLIIDPRDWHQDAGPSRAWSSVLKKWIAPPATLPALFYDRFTPRSPDEEAQHQRVLDILADRESTFAVPVPLLRDAQNKLTFHQLLTEHHLPTLPAWRLDSLTTSNLSTFIDQHGPLYLKPVRGSGGHGIGKLRLVDQRIEWQASGPVTFLEPDLSGNALQQLVGPDPYFVQPAAQIVPFEGAPYDIRALIQNDGNANYTVTGISVRLGQNEALVSNLEAGGSGRALEALEDHFREHFDRTAQQIREAVATLSQKTVDVLRATYGEFMEFALDLLLTRDRGLIILEGNTKPSRWVFVSIADGYPEGSPENRHYLDLRKRSVRLPLHYAHNTLR